MAKVKVRVLYPSAFVALGLEVEKDGKQLDEVTVDEGTELDALLAQGYAEPVKAKAVK